MARHLGYQPVVRQSAQEPGFGFIRIAGRRSSITDIPQMSEERIGARNDLVQLRITVVNIDILLGKRIIVELIGNAAVGAAAGYDGRIGAHIGKIVIVIGNITLRQRGVDAVKRCDNVLFGSIVIADCH